MPFVRAHRFFEDYKKNEHKEVIVDDFLGAEEAKKVVKDSLVGAMCNTCGRTAALPVCRRRTRRAQTRSCTVQHTGTDYRLGLCVLSHSKELRSRFHAHAEGSTRPKLVTDVYRP